MQTDYSFEVQQMVQAINSQAMATVDLTEQIARLVEQNQRMLEILIDVMAGDDPDSQPMRDMEGNPV